ASTPGRGADPAKARKPAHERTPRPLLRRFTDRLLQRLDPRVDEVDGAQVGVEGQLLGGILEALLAKPAPARDRPRRRWEQTAVTKPELRQPLPVAHPIKPRILARPHEIPGSLELRRGRRDQHA